MSTQTIHLHGFLNGLDDWKRTEAGIHSGPVFEVSHAVMGKVASLGHEVRNLGGRYESADGLPETLWYVVALEGDEGPSMWHTFTQPGEVWASIPPIDLGDAS